MFLLTAVISVFLSSCAFLSGMIKTSYERDENADTLIKENGLYINSVTVNKSFDSETVKENASYAFNIIPGVKPSGGLETDAVFKEESFVKGFDQLNTVSLELTVKDHNGSIIKTVLITEESENTLSSYKYLYRIIEKGIKEAGL